MNSAAPALPPPPPSREEGMLAVGAGHRIFWEESGAPDGVPTLYLHGGPVMAEHWRRAVTRMVDAELGRRQ